MKTRNHLLDLLKLIMAIGVVFVHFEFVGGAGKILASIGTMGVIVFFMISGYACYKPSGENNSENILRRMKRIIHLTIISVLIYIVFTAIESAIMNHFSDWVMNFRNPLLYPKMIFVGTFDFIHADHLWFLVALVYAYLFMYILEKKLQGDKIRKIIGILLPFLLLLRIGMETYTNSFGANWHLSGNAIVGAIPMLVLGYYLHAKENQINQIRGIVWITALVISYICMFLTVNFRVYNLDISQIFKISTAAISFICCMRYKDIMKENFLTRLGRDASLYIYVYHFLIGIALKDIFIYFGMEQTFIITFFPWIVTVISIFISYGIVYIGRGSEKNDDRKYANLIILRGNSGSGKTTIAKMLQRKLGHGTLCVSQDEIRREIIWVKDTPCNKSIVLMEKLLEYGKLNCEYTILEGILNSEIYSDLFVSAREMFGTHIHAYYFDIPFEETLVRHATKPNCDEFGEKEMLDWYVERDVIEVIDEKMIRKEQSLEEILDMILADIF